MFEKLSLGPQVLSNPSATQYLFLTELESRIGGADTIADPNNSFCYLGEFGSSLHAQAMRIMSGKFNTFYSVRSQTPADLSTHISDYDIFNQTASPASCMMRMLIPTEWIAQAATPYNETYNIIEYNANSVIKFAGKSWALYYPIQILYNPTTGNIVAYWNINTPNPLMTLTSDLLTDTHFEWSNGVRYLSISFPVYQFYRQEILETAITAVTGFTRSYPYSNKFYAVQISTLVNGVWQELEYSLSEQIYDTSTITALLTIDNDAGTLGVRIPQVYFSAGMMGTQVKVVIMTTEGKISFTVTDDDASNIQADFKPSTSTYSKMLGVNHGTILLPGYNQSTVVGGADPMPFADLRQAVIRNGLHDEAPISNLQLAVKVAKYGYTLTEYLDNVTNRVYYASAPIDDTDPNRVVPVVVSPVVIRPTDTLPSTVKVPGDGSITIMPSTVFSYNAATGTSTLVDDTTLAGLTQLSAKQLCAALNKVTYTRQPYHVWINTQTTAPQAKSYNLLSPTLSSLYVTGENDASPILSSVVEISVSHDNNGTGGFTFTFKAVRTTSMTNDQLAQTVLMIQFRDRSQNVISCIASYVGTDTSVGKDVYTLHLDSTYRLSADGFIQCFVPSWDGSVKLADLPMTLNLGIKTLVASAQIPGVSADPTLNTDVPTAYLTNNMVISAQTAEVVLGKDLSSVINNNVTTTWGDPVYQTWNVNIPYTFATDVYLRNSDGTMVVDMSSGKPVLLKIFSAGDPVPAGNDLSLTITRDAEMGTQKLTLASVDGLVPNMLVRGLNIVPGNFIQSITGTTITLAHPLLGDVPANSLLEAKAPYVQTSLTAAAKAGDTTLMLDPTGIAAGSVVYMKGVPAGTTATPNLTKTGVTLSAALTADAKLGDPAAFLLAGGPVSYRYVKGDVKRDQYNAPILAAASSNVYGITITQFDERIFRSQDVNDLSFAQSLPGWVYATATALDPVRADLLEQTKLYYRPYRTMGTASFTGGNGVVSQLPLEQSMAITYYMTESDKNNTAKTNLIKSSTLATLNAYLQKGTISPSVITDMLKEAFVGMISDVVVNVIDSADPEVLAVSTAGATPSVAYKLDVKEDGSLYYAPDVTFSFKTQPTSIIQATSATPTAL